MPLHSITDAEPSAPLIQNRLTVAGLVLMALFFSGGFSLSLYTHTGDTSRPFHRDFAHTELALALGACLALLAIVALLFCQQLRGDTKSWATSPRLWFAASTIWLYMALSQSMSAGLTELVYGLSISSPTIGIFVGAIALPVWTLLLFLAPLHLVRAFKRMGHVAESRALLAIYLASLLSILILTAEVYRLQSSAQFDAFAFLRGVAFQIVQPLTWWMQW